jgi:hypothetical protein
MCREKSQLDYKYSLIGFCLPGNHVSFKMEEYHEKTAAGAASPARRKQRRNGDYDGKQ